MDVLPMIAPFVAVLLVWALFAIADWRREMTELRGGNPVRVRDMKIEMDLLRSECDRSVESLRREVESLRRELSYRRTG